MTDDEAVEDMKEWVRTEHPEHAHEVDKLDVLVDEPQLPEFNELEGEMDKFVAVSDDGKLVLQQGFFDNILLPLAQLTDAEDGGLTDDEKAEFARMLRE